MRRGTSPVRWTAGSTAVRTTRQRTTTRVLAEQDPRPRRIAMTTRTARTGGAAVAGGLLLAASMTAEFAHAVQQPDGSLTAPRLFTTYLALWMLGAAALFRAVLGLR